MGYHYIFADTHHGTNAVASYLTRESERSGSKLHVSSTGDFWNYGANAAAPKKYDHPWVAAYNAGDAAGMKKHEPSWAKQARAQTAESGKKLRELREVLHGGEINAIMGNSDYAIQRTVARYAGSGLHETLGGSSSAVRHIKDIEVAKQGNTTFVYVPHHLRFGTADKRDYKTVKEELSQDSCYKALAQKVRKHGTQHVVVLMHESPNPNKWYDDKRSKSRLPDALRAHYDTILENIAKHCEEQRINVFHGHLHETAKVYNYATKTAKLPQVNVQHLNIDDIVKFDTQTGKYTVEKAGAGAHAPKAAEKPEGKIIQMPKGKMTERVAA